MDDVERKMSLIREVLYFDDLKAPLCRAVGWTEEEIEGMRKRDIERLKAF